MSHHYKSNRYENNDNSPFILLIRKHRKKILLGIVCVLVIILSLGIYIASFVISKVGQMNFAGIPQIPLLTQYIQALLPQDLIQAMSVFVSFLNLKQ